MYIFKYIFLYVLCMHAHVSVYTYVCVSWFYIRKYSQVLTIYLAKLEHQKAYLSGPGTIRVRKTPSHY